MEYSEMVHINDINDLDEENRENTQALIVTSVEAKLELIILEEYS
jgi:hypothetical protein